MNITDTLLSVSGVLGGNSGGGGGGGGIPGVYLIRGGTDPVALPDGLTMPQIEDIRAGSEGEGEVGAPYVSVRLLYCDADIHDDMMGEDGRARLSDGNLDSQSGTYYGFSTGGGQLNFDVSNGRISFSSGNYHDYSTIIKSENLDWAILVVDFR